MRKDLQINERILMRIYDIIEKKKNGGVLTKSEIDFFVKNYTNGAIPDYQAAPLLMAICFNSMNAQECADLTMAMADSGAKLDLSSVGGVTADKHSTGGVGDKATLLVAPICAACGVKMAKMSGRGLGFTGGTADKLESIPGFTVSLDKDKFMKQVKNIGISVISQSADLAPADKKLYALRDVTATVDSLPLIASSIMSKKLAAGADVIVLDVKCGSGAFMKTKEDAEQLAKLMVDIGTKAGRKVCAIVSDMAQPLGTQVGNILEVREAVDALKKPRNAAPDLMEDCVTLSSLILMLSGKADSMDNAKTRVWQVLEKGDAYQKFKDMVKAQGGDVSYIDDTSKFDVVEVNLEKGDILLNDNGVHKNDAGEAVRVSYDFKAKKDGYITKMDTEAIGKAACILGAGREKIGDLIDFNSGITFLKKLGDSVNEGDTICVLHSTTNEKLRIADDVLNGAIKINPNPDVSLYNSAGKISHVYSYVLPAGIVQVSCDEKADSKSLRMLLNATPNAAD
jgi:pyrimidine-nucleoside phosphorylase